jgi:hypothetical protein
MELLIQPTLDSVREDMGYEEWEDVDDVLLFQQGYDSVCMEVEDGDSFVIPEGFIGRIADEGMSYYMNIEVADGVWEKEELFGELEAGNYNLNGNIISRE